MNKIKWESCRVKLSDLRPWNRNPKFSTKAQATRIIKSFERFGQAEPINVSPTNQVYNGHQRLSALLTLYGVDYEITAWRSNVEFSEEQKQDFTVTMHAGAVGSFNWDALSSWDAASLKEWGMDADYLKMLNNDANNVKEMLKSSEPVTVDAEPQTDRAEELREKWQTERGQLWAIGETRLLCGDSTVREDVERVMGGEKATLAPVDPPYNVGFDYDGETVDDKKTAEKYETFSRAWFGECQRISDKQIVTPGCNNLSKWLRWFDVYHVAPWVKSNAMTNGKTSRFWCWEPVVFFGDSFGKKRSNDIFNFPIGNQKGVSDHPCPKPLEMWTDLVSNYSDENDIIFESFAGSGTTLVACQNLNRRGRGIEISPAYCAVILERMITAFPDLDIHLID